MTNNLPIWPDVSSHWMPAAQEQFFVGDQKLFMVCTEEDIRARIHTMADEIAEKFRGAVDERNPLMLVNILEGATFLAADLSRALRWRGIPNDLCAVKVVSYDEHNSRLEHPHIFMPVDAFQKLNLRHCVMVDEISDTGGTFRALKEELERSVNPRTVHSAALITRKEGAADFTGQLFTSGEWLVGYGLDGDNMLRSLPFVAGIPGTGKG